MTAGPQFELEQVDFEKGGGFVTVVTQDAITGAVLMVARADRDALLKTLATGEMHYHSRTRGLWHKGATSGNTQRVTRLELDCDRDVVLATVESAGPACHTGAETCFGPAHASAVGELDRVTAQRASSEAKGASYTQKLLGDRNLRLKKIGEEAAELVTACADADKERATEEAADLLYHSLVALRAIGVGLPEVLRVLHRRAAKSGNARPG